MTKMANWTKEQELAINANGCSIIVSAAAGSGKTSVLVERLLRMLSNDVDKIYADRIVVATFSKASASEMKERLVKSITKQIDLHPENDWLIQQHAMLQSAKISTIHSFCFDLIRDNIDTLDVSSNFKIVEPADEKVLCLKAIQESIEDMYTQKHDDMLFLSQTLCDKTDDVLDSILYDLYRFLMSVPFFEDWLQTKCIDYYSKDDMFNDEAIDSAFEHLIDNFKECLVLNQRAIELAEDASDDKCLNILYNENNFLIDSIESLKTSDRYDPNVIGAMDSFKFGKISFNKDTDSQTHNNIILYRDEYKKIFKSRRVNLKVLKDAMENYSTDKAINKKVSIILSELVCDIHSRLNAIKAEENVLGFSDAEQICIKLLAKKDDKGNIVKTDLAEKLSEYYQIIMLDEFQDTNNNQDLIFKMISKNGTAEKMGSNMFVVGDVKQSIYNFRLANPQNFIDVINYSKPYKEDDKPQNAYIKLNRNFRSSRDVIDFVNFVFENIMSEDMGEIVYDDNEKLIYGANYPQGDRRTEIPIIDTNRFSVEEYVAKTIKSMIDNKYPVTDRDGSVRCCRPSDFCLLFMTSASMVSYFEKLQDVGLSVDFEKDEEFLKSREVSLLFNMLKIVDNPMDNIAMTSIMMSPLFMFTPDDVANIRLVNRDSSVYSSVLEIYVDIKKIYPADLVAKVKHLVDTLNLLRNLSANCTSYELLSAIIDATDLISVMQVYDTSNHRRENIQVFLKIAQNHDNNSTTGISGFIRYINTILDNKEDIDVKNHNNVSNSVIIKTMHKSKGLEYPFVFICNVEKKFNESDTSDIIQKNFKHGLAYQLKDRESFLRYETIDKIRITSDKLSELRSEKMRLMYVSFTRAKEKLFIPLGLSASDTEITNISKYMNTIQYEERIPPYLVKNSIYMRDWLLMTLCCCDKAKPLRDFLALPDVNIIKYPSKLNMYIYNPSEDTTTTEDTPTCNDTIFAVDETLKQDIINSCNFKYVNEKADLPARISVSTIVQSSRDDFQIKSTILGINPTVEDTEENLNSELRTPNFMNVETLTPAEKGTAIHKVMQYCNFENLSKDINEELHRLVAEGFISVEQFKVVDVRVFKRLIHSDIFELIKNNKVQRERDFLVKVSDLNLQSEALNLYKDTETMLQGCMDMIVFEPDGITIIDYKTDNVFTMETLKERYALQIQLYRSALSLIENLPIKRTLIYSMKLGKSIEIE